MTFESAPTRSSSVAVAHTNSGGDFEVNLTSVERVISRSPIAALGEYRCPVEHPQFAGGGPQRCPFIVFPRTTVRILPDRWRSTVCSPNIVSLYNVGDTYERKAISSEGDQSDWIAISPELLREIAMPYIPQSNIDSDGIFSQPFAPLDPRIYLKQRILFRAIQDGDNRLSTLAIEEHVIDLVDGILRSSNRFWMRGCRPAQRANASMERRQIAIVDETKEIVAKQYCEPLSIAHIACRVNCSPGYLCRTFKRLTGFTLHSYLQHLRLRASLQLLLESWMDFAGIAEHLGFSSHSHFTETFRRQFGITPTAFVKRGSTNLSGHLSVMLDEVAQFAGVRAKAALVAT